MKDQEQLEQEDEGGEHKMGSLEELNRGKKRVEQNSDFVNKEVKQGRKFVTLRTK